MSNSLLTNNSLTNLSKTFEKQMVYGDIEVLIEAAAFSSGDLFYIRMIIEPTLKHTRLENMEVTVTESRRYCVPEMKAWRTDSTTFPMKFAGSVRLAEFGEVNITTDELRPAFDKTAQGIELEHTFAHRISFATPTCQQNIHHTTYVKEIQFRHHIDINLTMSYIDQDGNKQTSQLSTSGTVNTPTEPSGTLTPPPAAHFSHNSRSNSSQSIQRLSSPSTPSSSANTSPRLPSAILPATPTNTQNNLSQNSNSPGWQNMILRLSKSKGEKDGSGNGRRVETIILDTPIIVFDCRLKEDYGRLPSYSELGTKFSETTEYPSDKQEMKIKHKKGTIPLSMDKPSVPHPYLCPCYHAFCREMELASQALYLPAEAAPAMPLLDRIPSIPPPDYVD
jgi:hypothetical protein